MLHMKSLLFHAQHCKGNQGMAMTNVVMLSGYFFSAWCIGCSHKVGEERILIHGFLGDIIFIWANRMDQNYHIYTLSPRFCLIPVCGCCIEHMEAMIVVSVHDRKV